MKITITPTLEDVRDSHYLDVRNCAITKAINRALGTTSKVDPGNPFIAHTGFYISLCRCMGSSGGWMTIERANSYEEVSDISSHVQDMYNNFEREGGLLRERAFEIEIPDHWIPLLTKQS